MCVSGLGFPVEYISKLGKKAMEEQKERLETRKKSFSILDDLEELEEETEVPIKKVTSKRRQVSLDLIRELD